MTALAVVLAGCSGTATPGPEEAADALAAGLTHDHLTGVSFTGETAAQAQRWWDRVIDGMGGPASTVSPQVRVVSVAKSGDTAAKATLRYTWDLAGSPADWSYTTKVPLTRRGDAWAVSLRPDAVAPGLRSGERLRSTSVQAERGDILGAGGTPLVTDRPVVRFGIDKTQVEPGRQAASARALAQLLGIDPGDYVDQVRAAGEKAFVEALVLRAGDVTPRIESGYPKIKGAVGLHDKIPLAPTREFARELLGTVAPVTAEMVRKSHGTYQAGDVAGVGGLEERYDARLRGTPGVVVEAFDPATNRGRTLFRTRPRPGKPLRTTLDPHLQSLAEDALSGVSPASALVAVRPSTGELLAAASGPGSDGLPTATYGRYAPGSTFKVVTSLALLRAGLSADSTVACTPTLVVDGRRFRNYSDYPSYALGRITLRQAFAHSCNTAFISQRNRVSAGQVADAAASLGLGVDHDIGFPAFFGSVPADASGTGYAAELIGQGEVLASPLAMATVAGSVAAGRTVVPHLIDGIAPKATPSRPLTAREARTLRQLMAAVVEEGSGSFLADLPGPPVLAKTGTAEFGTGHPLKTHAWMIAAQGDLAVAVFVDVGESGSQTAGPVLEQFLRGAR